MRIDKRKNNELRQVKITPNFLEYPSGSVLIETGKTRVLCTAMIEDSVPKFLKGQGKGWLSAEYGMLPASTPDRKQRDAVKGKIDGRSQEIQRLVGRSLRNIVDMEKLGERTIWIDCDVLQADGGTRTAAVTGGYSALKLAVKNLLKSGVFLENPLTGVIAAVSVGIVNGECLLDLCYDEDSQAEVDMNVVMTDKGEFIEVQGTGEKKSFNKKQLDTLLGLAEKGIEKLFNIQRKAVGK